MERLPYIDTHTRRIEASPDGVWEALLGTLRRQFRGGLPGPVAAAWGLQQTERRGEWKSRVAVGDTIPGFRVAEADSSRRLTLRGEHRFARYELRFELAEAGADSVQLRAVTSALFPGVHGQIYRLLVIGSGGHRVAVRRMLGAIASRAADSGSDRAFVSAGRQVRAS
jgi:hypothetical protein